MTSIIGIDTVIQAPVQSQTGYIWSDVRFDQSFVEFTKIGKTSASKWTTVASTKPNQFRIKLISST